MITMGQRMAVVVLALGTEAFNVEEYGGAMSILVRTAVVGMAS